MTTVFDSDVYAEARANRLRNLFAHVNPDTIQGKRVLELGCGTGELGEEFVKLGAEVVSLDARGEHITELWERFPKRHAARWDVEATGFWPFGLFDIVLCWGLLYHLAAPKPFLARYSQVAPVLYLETQITDLAENFYSVAKEEGADQSYCGCGCRPTPKWIEANLQTLGYQVEDISGPLANWPGAVFDWAPQNDGQSMRNGNMLRKMYVCRREA